LPRGCLSQRCRPAGSFAVAFVVAVVAAGSGSSNRAAVASGFAFVVAVDFAFVVALVAAGCF
jgi:hypothetical protein